MNNFWKNVDRSAGAEQCWPWLLSTGNSGYGNCKYGGKARSAHAVALELSGRTVPQGHEVMHVCHNPRCCNPSHLVIGTHRENMAAAGQRRKGKFRVLSEIIVRAARKMRQLGHKIVDIAREFGVRADTMGAAISGKNWAWVV